MRVGNLLVEDTFGMRLQDRAGAEVAVISVQRPKSTDAQFER